MISKGIVGVIAASVRERFFDIFSSRSNTSGNLGIASDGSQWRAVNGTIQVVSGAATATTTPTSGSPGTSYPMATVDMPTTDNVIELSGVKQGSSVAVWVQSSSDWWMVDVDSTFNTIPGNTNYGYSQNAYVFDGNYNAYFYYYAYTNPQSNNINSYQAPYTGGQYTAYDYYYYFVVGYNVTYSGNSGFSYTNNTPYFHYVAAYGQSTANDIASNYSQAPYGGGGTYSVVGNYYYYYAYGFTNGGGTPVYSGGTYNYTSYTNATTYAYNEIIRISQSVSSVVSTITSSVISTAQTILSLRVKTSGNQITAQGFSDNNFVTQVGSNLVYNATGATITTRYGISVSPSAYQQSAIIGTSVAIKRN